MQACKADCTVAALAGSFHPLTTGGRRRGGAALLPSVPLTPPPLHPSSSSFFFFFFFWTVQWSFPVTAVLLSRGGGSSTGREAAWDRWTCPAPPPTTASLIKNRSAATIDVFSRVGATDSGGEGGGGGKVGGATFPVLRERWSSVMLQEAELHFSFRFLPVSVQLARLK